MTRIFGGIVAADSSGAVSAWEGTGSRLEGGSYVVVEYNRDNGGDDNADRACPQEAARRNGILGHKAILRPPLWHIYTIPLDRHVTRLLSLLSRSNTNYRSIAQPRAVSCG